MSNFHPTIGRSVQFVNENNVIQGAVISGVNGDTTVTLHVFVPNGLEIVYNVRPFVIGARASENLRTYKLHWQNR